MFKRENKRNKLCTFITALMLVVFMLFPASALAQGLPTYDNAQFFQRAGEFAKVEADKIKDEVSEGLAHAIFVNVVGSFVNNLASKTAKWIASGDDGQKPLLFTSEWGEYLQNAGEDAVARSAIQFADGVGLGNICQSPQIAIDVILPKISVPGPSEPRCSLDELKETWNVTSPDFLENFTLSFQTKQNDIGIAMDFLNKVEREKAEEQLAAENERDQSPFKAVKDKVSKWVQTPGQQIGATLNDIGDTSSKTKTVFTNTVGVIAGGALQAFAGTLLNQYVSRLQNGFFSLADVAQIDPNENVQQDVRNALTDSEATGPTGSEIADLKFSQVLKPNIQQANDFNILGELASCPSEVKYAGLYNCVIDNAFVQALSGGETGFLTVREAMEQGLLHEDWAFGYTDPGTATEPSYRNGYAYSNMKKLRRFRIIPVGWEMAALRARQLNRRVTLGDVIEAFDEEGSPFENLVDPNWVLKVPNHRCHAEAPGQILEPSGGGRSDTCVDVQDCVAFGDDGECLSWGYCTAEEKTWNFPGERCAEQFATCEQLRVAGEDSSRDNLWLTSTLDYEACNAENAGCSWYALVQNEAGEWQDSQKMYLSSNAETCEEEDAGCYRYIRAGGGTNLIKNSSFEDDGGHNYVLGDGDTQAENGIPDGWSARQAQVSLSDNSINGDSAVRVQAQSGGECRPGLQYESPIGSFESGQMYTLSGRVRTDGSARDIQLAFQDLTFTVQDVSTSWQSFAFQFIMPSTTRSYTMVLGTNTGDCGDLNEGNGVFYDAIQMEQGQTASSYKQYGDINEVTLQDAPSCTFEDVGCQRYIPQDSSQSEVVGVATGQDVCPQECVGYATYEQQATGLEPSERVNFIPSSAVTCSASDVGCEQFTNLDAVAEGGEGLEHYSQIRHCETPQPQCQTYFAWEGSDSTGYQLENFNLLAQNSDGTGAPMTTDGSTTCDPNDPNCRELIAEDGARSFRQLNRTITCSDACTPLRARPGLVDQQECEDRLGEWDAASQRCVFQAIPEQSRQCQAQAVGCREYLGTSGHNIAYVLADDFEASSLQGWTNGERSTEAISVGGHSLRLGDQANEIDAQTRIQVDNLSPTRNYVLQLSAKSSVSDFVTISVYLGDQLTDSTRVGSFVTGTLNWNQYEVGPFELPASSDGTETLTITAEGTSASGDDMNVFLDNLQLKQIQDSLYVTKNSWETPAACDTSPPLENGSASRSMTGCQAYRIEGDAAERVRYLKSFTRLCSEDKIGCEAMFDTFNSSAPYREIYQEGDEAETVVPQDQVRYIVNREQYSCEEEQVGCMALGKPTLNQENQVESYETVYLKNNPDQYDEILCKEDALFCKAFQNSRDEVVYAKDPGERECEYRQVPDSFPIRYAWYRVGDDEENPEECLQAEESDYARRCPLNEVSCTQYYEPISDRSYYYKKNTINESAKSECNGVVDWEQGCVLFDDLSVSDKYFRSGDDPDFNGSPEGCQTGDVGCNTNTLLRVELDRQCSQWLQGVSTSRFWDKNLQQFRTTSYGLGECTKADDVNPNVCSEWDTEPNQEPLTISNYQSRERGWVSDELSGYSIPNTYPIHTLRQRSVSRDEDGNPQNFRLTRLDDPTPEDDALVECTSDEECNQGAGEVCHIELDNESGEFVGHCYIDSGIDGSGRVETAACRAFPESDSPFPSHLATYASSDNEENPNQIISKAQNFTNANIAAKGEDVQCSYHKVSYTGERRYYGLDTIPPSEITVDGDVTEFDTKDTFIGWEGYCLERDPSRLINGTDDQYACLTWYPVDTIQGAFDLNNSGLSAGYRVAEGAEYYCVEATFAEYRTTWQFCDRAQCGSGYTTTRRDDCAGHDHHRRECNPIGGDGWYPYDGDLKGSETLGVMCSKAARIADSRGRSAAWTTRIRGETLPGSQEYFVEDLDWGYEQANTPYGVIRSGVNRLEDISKPLMVLNPNEFAVDCEECEVETYGGYNVEDSTRPFGTCQDEDPDRNGKPCPLFPNAGSPYSFDTKGADELLTDENIPVRPDNQRREDAPQPYTESETFEDGFDRLQELFARSYGVWEWRGEPAVCIGTCQGGLNEGVTCNEASDCGVEEPNIDYTCEPNICIGGANAGQTCESTDDCRFEDTDTIYQCVELEGAEQDAENPQFVCESGPWAGITCTTHEDCSVESAQGVCSGEDTRCRATNADGELVTGFNSGSACNNADECSEVGVCQVERCSTEDPGSTSGICEGKVAGERCSETSLNKRYVQLTPSDEAFGWDLIDRNPNIPDPPVVRPVVSDPNSATGFSEGFSTAITVNGETSGTIAAQGGVAPVSVSFYAYNENGEQMPLRTILVDWGDDSDPAESRGAFKNHKHECRTFCSNSPGVACERDVDCQTNEEPNATCDPLNFGDSEDACIEDNEGANAFFSFSYTYTCEGPDPCTYTPQVLVRDNWGATSRVSFEGEVVVQPEPQEE